VVPRPQQERCPLTKDEEMMFGMIVIRTYSFMTVAELSRQLYNNRPTTTAGDQDVY